MIGRFGTWQTWTAGVLLALVAYLLSWAGVELTRRIAEQRNLLDVPNERSSHSMPTPRGGGVAIAAVTVCFAAVVSLIWGESRPFAIIATLAAWVGVAGISFVDDVHTVSIRIRFAVHGLAALTVIIALGHWERIALPMAGEVWLGIVGAVVAFFWLTGLTNAYNFMDGIDGIAGLQAIVAGLGWALAGALLGAMQVAAVGLVIAGASLGFTQHNWAPARIFMGDVGSAFLGLSLASIAVGAAELDARLAFFGVLVVWPFVFDASFTLVRRAVRRENVLAAHRSHLYQRLVILGFSHARVSMLYAALATVGVILGIVWLGGLAVVGKVTVIVIPLLAFGLWCYVLAQERACQTALRKRT